MKKRLMAMLMAAVMAVSLTACGGGGSSAGSDSSGGDGKAKIGLSMPTQSLERWNRDGAYLEEQFQNAGYDTILTYSDNDSGKQVNDIQNMLADGADLLVIAAIDGEALNTALDEAAEAGVPVIAYDRLILNTKIDLYITIDSGQVGVIMGKELQRIAPLRNWLCILGPQEDYNMKMLLRGLNGTIKNSLPIINEIFYTQDWNYDLSRQKMVDVITSGKIPGAIICGNDAVADSVISVLQAYYPDKHIPICGQDADIAACQNIVRGLQDFTVYKPIVELARTAAEISVRVARGEKIQSLSNLKSIDNKFAEIPAILLKPVLVTKSNVDDVIIDSGFHTYGEVYME